MWEEDGLNNGTTTVPPLPIDGTTPGQLPSNFLQGIVLNQDLSTVHAPVRHGIPQSLVETVPPTPVDQYPPMSPYDLGSAASTPVSRINTISTSIASSPSTFITTGASSLPPAPSIRAQRKESSPPWLGDPSLPINKAIFVASRANKRVKLDYYRFTPVLGAGVSKGRIIEWRGENPGHLVRHHIPADPHDTFPYTKHSVLQKDKLRLIIHTPGHSTHKVVLKSGEKLVMNEKDEIEYRFTSEEGLKKFQSDLRDKELLGSYETDKVKCKNGTHINECVKLWRSRDGDGDCSLTFFASGSNEGDVEYPLRWIQSPFKRNEAKREVTLDLLKKPPDLESKKRGILGRRKSSSATSPYGGDISPVSPSGKRGSTVTMDSTASSNATSDDLPIYCPDNIHDKVRTMIFTFSADKDFKAFLQMYQIALQPSLDPRPLSTTSTWTDREALRMSRASSVYSMPQDTISELGDPAIAGSLAAEATDAGQGVYHEPHNSAQELPAVTPSMHLWGAAPTASPQLGQVQHPAGFTGLFSEQPRLTPPSPLSPLARAQNRGASGDAGGLGLVPHSYDVPDLATRREPVERHTQTRTERFELDGRLDQRFELGDAQYGEKFELPSRTQTRKGKESENGMKGSGYIPYRAQ